MAPPPASRRLAIPRRDALWRVAAVAALVSTVAEAQPIVGVVRDSASGAPIAAAQVSAGVHLTTTNSDGRFLLRLAPSDPSLLAIRRIGYHPHRHLLTAEDRRQRDTVRVTVTLRGTALALAGITVRAPAAPRAATVLDGVALDRALAPSIAATIAGEPGITMRTNGPVATQPVIRGLSGDRVVVLEDGLRTGDIATTAADHAITIDPITARRIEIIRGPAALRYASTVLGGVIDVVREDIPRTRAEGLTGAIGTQGESVNGGGALGGGLSAPLGPLAMRLTGSLRTASDTRTPQGGLPFTDFDGFDVGLGSAWVGARHRVGAAVRDVRNFYGVPSSFGGVTLPGSHDGGVYVDLRRSTARVEGDWQRDTLAQPRGVTGASVAVQGIRFEQEELERGGFVGTRFGQLAVNADALVRYRRGTTHVAHGQVGVTTQWRDFRAEGSFTGTRPAVVTQQALFAHETMTVGRLELSAGARVDRVRIRPLDSTETRLLRDVRSRAFDAITGAVGATWAVRPSIQVGTTVARAFRPPAIEELYSAGPHLATYGYEIGNPRLDAERGWGTDLLVRVTRDRLVAEASAYRLWIDGFVYQAPQLDPATGGPLLDPRLRRYQVYQASQTRAAMTGAEGRLQWEFARGWALDGTASLVTGTRLRADSAAGLSAGAPLPAIPPLRGRLQLRRDGTRWLVGATLEGGGAQTRIPAPAQQTASCTPRIGLDGVATGLRPAEFCPTDGFLLVHSVIGRRWAVGRRLHALTLAVDNLLDRPWRDHLWRAKQVAPQPGRNLRLLYRVTL